MDAGQEPLARSRDDRLYQYVTCSQRQCQVTTAFCVETIVTCFSYLQIYSMHEIIAVFDKPQPDDGDRAYARLMCWGLFIGQTTECVLSAYSWSVSLPMYGKTAHCRSRENYLLHIPVKMSVASLVSPLEQKGRLLTELVVPKDPSHNGRQNGGSSQSLRVRHSSRERAKSDDQSFDH